jgi:hypothetical protein
MLRYVESWQAGFAMTGGPISRGALGEVRLEFAENNFSETESASSPLCVRSRTLSLLAGHETIAIVITIATTINHIFLSRARYPNPSRRHRRTDGAELAPPRWTQGRPVNAIPPSWLGGFIKEKVPPPIIDGLSCLGNTLNPTRRPLGQPATSAQEILLEPDAG